MDNLRRRFNSPTKSVPPTSAAGMGTGSTPEAETEPPEPEVDPERKSVFHAPFPGMLDAPDVKTDWSAGAIREAEARIADHLAGVESFCGTGAVAVGQLAGLLRGSRYAGVADQCQHRLEEVQCATKAEVAQVAAEVKATLAKVGGGGGAPGSKATTENGLQDSASEEDIKLVASAFTRLMQLHCQFLLTASEVLTPLSKYVNDSSLPEPTDKSDKASQSKPAAGQLSQSNSPPQETSQSAAGIQGNEQDSSLKSPTAETKSNTNTVHAVGSPSGLRKISSFFSKLARSGSVSSEGPQSSFYVSIPKDAEPPEGHDKENRDETKQSSNRPAAPEEGEEGSITATLNKLNLPPGATDISQVMPGLPNGRLATQEELDSVIDLLSGGQRSPMQVIPENVPSHHVSSKLPIGPLPPPYPHHPHQHLPPPQHPLFAVLPATDTPPPPLPPTHHHHHHHHPDGSGHNGLYRANHHHRRSDSMLAENFPREQKTNTWPYRPHARSAAGDLGPTSLVHTIGGGVYDGGGGGGAADVDYTRYLAAVKAMKAGSSGSSGAGPLGGSLGGQGPWSTGDSGLHRSWPMHLFNHDGAENASRNWSTVGDSSSCSDESSSGDAPWMMGLDLVGAVSDKRRHSSGEESFPGPPPPGHVTETRPRSVENLLDSKSTNTWPPKQPWPKLGVPGGHREDGLGPGGPQLTGHPPLTMQWSDPLTNRPLSAWDGGTIPSFSNQRLQSFPSLTQGGSTEFLPPSGLHERHHPVRR